LSELSAFGLKAKLSALSKSPPTKPVRIGAGGGLHLLIKPAQSPGTGAWVFRFVAGGKRRDMGLGTYPTVGLAAARLAAQEARSSAMLGLDPISSRAAARVAASQVVITTFEAAAEACYASRQGSWKNAKHGEQWIATLRTHVFPKIGTKPVASIATEDVVAVLKPIWSRIPETASRVRGRIENVLSYASASGIRPVGPNPAAWRGNLSELLGAPSRLKAAARRSRGKGENFPSLPHSDLPRFFVELEGRSGMAALALRFAILVAARTGEVRAMTWNEVDLKAAVWIIPEAKMKAGRTHFVPLTAAAISVLELVRPLQTGPRSLVFPSRKAGKPLSDMALSMLVRGMATDGVIEGERPRWSDPEGRAVVPHGFRACFKAWSLANGWPDHLSEKALAHSDKDKVRAAYAREPLTEERRPMMAAWACACLPKLNALQLERTS
jgi:integrase